MHRTLRPFELLEPETVMEAVNTLNSYGNKTKVLAGGIDLVSRMRRWQMKPEYLVSIRKIPGLDRIESNGTGVLRIGALTTLRSVELSPAVQKVWSILHEATNQIASIQVKTMGTVVGNLCVATPASDIAPTLFVLGAEVKIVGPASEKTIPIENFLVPVCQNILQPNEIVTGISVPRVTDGSAGAFLKLAHTAACIAKVNVAVMVTIKDDICQDIKIALGAVAPCVIRAMRAEEIIKGKKLDEKTIARAAEAAAEEVRPITDLRSTAEYRKEMVTVLVRRAIEKASARAKP
ncbi:FAD binding domain-containing protein [Chloroflexota bacterium]